MIHVVIDQLTASIPNLARLKQTVLVLTHTHLTTPHHTTLHYTTLHYTTLHYTTLHYTTLHYTTPHHTTLHHTTPHHTTHHTTPHYTTLHHTTLHHTTPHYTTLHYTTPHHTTLHYTQSSHHYGIRTIGETIPEIVTIREYFAMFGMNIELLQMGTLRRKPSPPGQSNRVRPTQQWQESGPVSLPLSLITDSINIQY